MARAGAERGGRRGTVASRRERVGGEHGVAQERLGRALAQAPDGQERKGGHVVRLVLILVGPQPREGVLALAPGFISPAQVCSRLN